MEECCWEWQVLLGMLGWRVLQPYVQGRALLGRLCGSRNLQHASEGEPVLWWLMVAPPSLASLVGLIAV